MLWAFFGRFYREILIIVNIFAAYTWMWPFTDANPKWWQVLLFVLSFIIEFFSLMFVMDGIGETDFTWRKKWKNFCRFDKRNCKACGHSEYCKHSTCQHKSLRNGRYYLLKILGH
jgi:hypothetical protein